jgi:hypothetical protein
VLLVASGGLFVVGILVLRVGATRALHAGAVVYALQFPANLEEEAVQRLLSALAGLLPPWWQRLVTQPVVFFETVATEAGIEHRLIVPRARAGTVENALQAVVPNVRWQRVDSAPENELMLGVEYRTTTNRRPMRADPSGIAAGLLSSLQPLRKGERVVVQWLLTPAGPVRPPRLATRDDGPVTLDAELLANAEAVTALRTKQRAPLLLACGRIAVCAATRSRAVQLLRQTEAPLHGTRAPGVHLRRRLLPSQLIAGRVERRTIPLTRFPGVLNVEEASCVIAWPIGLGSVPGLQLGGCRLLPVPGAVRRRGTVIGESTFPGMVGRPVALNRDARLRHLVLTGPTGTGKSTLIASMVEQDLRAGHGVVCIDPKGDLCDAIAARIPDGRLDDVVVLDPADDEWPVGYNPLAASGVNRELVVEQCLGVMRSIWRSSWGPRTDEILRGCLLALTAHSGMTLCEIPALLTDPGFRRRILARVDDPLGVESFWGTFEAWSDGERLQATAPVLNKTRAIAMRPRLRGVFGQVRPAVDFSRLIRERKVLLVNLASGRIGTEAARLLGALLFAGLWDAVSARANQPHAERPMVACYIDEFQHVVALNTPAEEILAEARGYGLALTVAHQHLGQLDTDLEHAVLANARSKVLFQTSRHDAGVFARELGGGLTPEDLMGIAPYEAVVAAFAAGGVQPPATIRTLPLGPATRPASEVYGRSRRRWGVERAEVERQMIERQVGPRRAGSVGRGPRSAS